MEKLFAIHSKIELLKRDGRSLGSYARHYYDLYQLAQKPEVIAMLQSEEYAEIRDDYDHISREHFARDYFPPEGLRFSNSEALYPPEALEEIIRAEYERQCKVLCYGAYPTWDEVRERLEGIRGML